ncbi:MAG TPA: hypothetical protein VES42_20320 [Pilimelia sp.]|nr:hypothetical protein [Pilimelia sp.]
MESSPSRGVLIVGWLGLLAHAALFFWFAASGLVAPGWAVALLLAMWAGLLLFGAWLRRRRPLLTPLVPIAALLLWLAVITAGETLLNWTA